MAFDNDITLSVGLNTDNVTHKAEELDNNIRDIFQKASNSDNLTNSFRNLLSSMDKALKRSRDIREQMKQYEGITVPTDEYAMYENALDKLQTKMNALIERRDKFLYLGGSRDSNVFRSMEYDAQILQQQIDEVHMAMRNLRDAGEAFVPGVDTTEYANLVERLNQCNNALTIYTIKAQEAEDETLTFGQRAAEIFSNLASSIAQAVSGLARFTVGGVVKGLKSLAEHAAKAATNLVKIASNDIRKRISSLGNAIKSLGKHTKSSNNMLNVGFKQFLRYGLGVRSVFTLIRKLRTALIEGLENLGNYDTNFGQTIDNFKIALETLKNSFASAFAPVVQVVLPILTQFIEKLSSVVTLVGKFIAALTGKSSFTQATRAQKQYKKAVDATGKSVKEAKRELYGFDEITKQQDDTATSGGTGNTGNDKDDIVGGFKNVPIDGWLKDLADKIRNFFKSKDWVGLGTFLGESINKIFQKAKEFLDNPVLLNKIYEVIDAITTTFNSLVSAIDWPLIGSTFASGINLIINAVDRLITGVDWKNIGASIASGLDSMIHSIDWIKIGQTLGHLLSIIPQTLSNFYANIDWYNLGQSIARGLNNMINSIDWDSVAGWVYNKINALINLIQGFVRTFDWGGFATKLSSYVNNVVKNIDWAKAGQTLSDIFKKILGFITKAIEEIDWKAFGEKVKEFLVNIDWAGVAQALFEALGAAIGGLAAFLWGLIEDAWNSVVDWFKDATKDGGTQAIKGLFDGIVEALKNVGQWIKDHIFKPFIDGFKKAFGIASPSKEMAKMGVYVIQGLLNGITSIIKGIGSWIKEHIFKPIKDGIATAFGIVGGIAKNLVETGKSIVGGIKSGASNAWSTVSSVFSTGINNIKAMFKIDWLSVGTMVVSGIYNGISNLWGNVTGFFSRAVQNIKSFFLNTNWQNIGLNICAGIRNGLSSGANAVVQTAKNVASKVLNAAKRFLGIRSPSTVFRDEVGKMISAGLAVGIDDNATKAINSVNELGKSITSEAMGIKVPAIAAGNVVPYNSTNNSTTAQNSMIDSMLSKLAPIIQGALLNAISESDGFDVNFNVNGDPNKLFTVVREKGLQYQQMTGKPVFD